VHFVFDMDGTLVDSFAAVKEAYRLVGFKLLPEHWGKTWKEIGVTPEQHKEKNALYSTCLRSQGRILHAATLMQVVEGKVLTGASVEAAKAVFDLLGLPLQNHLLAAGVTQEQKFGHLRKLAKDGRVFYVDDDRNFGLRIVQDIPNAFFLHVAEHEGVYHLHNKKGEVQRWTLSSWLPDVTIV
jgi:hypothetical protein